MYKIKPLDPIKLEKDIKLMMLFSNIFGVMFFFSISRAFLISSSYEAFNAIIFLLFFVCCTILDKVNRLRLELHKK